LREAKALRSEKDKELECGLCYEQRREVKQGLRVIGINFDINVGRTALE
jgi:hypothetical protein